MTEKKEIDRSKLGELYPKVKTYDELEHDRKIIRIIRRQRYPRRRILMTASVLTLATVCGTVAVFFAQLLFGLGALAGVSFSFMLGLMALGVAALALRTAAPWYERTGQAIGRLVVVYVFVLLPVYGVTIQFLSSTIPLIITLIVGISIHFGLAALVVRMAYGRTPTGAEVDEAISLT